MDAGNPILNIKAAVIAVIAFWQSLQATTAWVNLVGPLDVEKIVKASFLCVFNIGFPASLL